jgi:hypothetical protein
MTVRAGDDGSNHGQPITAIVPVTESRFFRRMEIAE